MARSVKVVESRVPDPPVYPYPYPYPHTAQPYEYESAERPGRSNAGRGLLVLLLIILLIAGWRFFPFRESGLNITPFVDTPQTQSQIAPAAPPPRLATTARVDADSLYLREGPGTESLATYLLPRDWPLTLLEGSQLDNEGEVWVRVRLETNEGPQEGWVNQRFIR